MIAANYMSAWLLWDVLASIPISFYEVTQYDPAATGAANQLQGLGTLKILKVVRFRT